MLEGLAIPRPQCIYRSPKVAIVQISSGTGNSCKRGVISWFGCLKMSSLLKSRSSSGVTGNTMALIPLYIYLEGEMKG